MRRQLPQLQYHTRRIGQAWDLPDFHPPRFMGFRQFRPHILTFEEQTNAVRADEIAVHRQRRLGSGAQARAVTTSKVCGAASSIRTFRISTSRLHSSAAAFRKAAFLAVASNRVTATRPRSNSAKTRPGKPAPEPRSTRVLASWRDEGAPTGRNPRNAAARHPPGSARKRDYAGNSSLLAGRHRPSSRANVSRETWVAAANSSGPKWPSGTFGLFPGLHMRQDQGERGRGHAFDAASLAEGPGADALPASGELRWKGRSPRHNRG